MKPRWEIFALGLVCGCGSWQRVELRSDTTLAPRQQVQVWRGHNAKLLHAVRLSADSVVGVPFQLPPSCDTCRVAYARSDIDSLRVGDQETAAMLVSALPFLALGVLMITLAGVKD